MNDTLERNFDALKDLMSCDGSNGLVAALIAIDPDFSGDIPTTFIMFGPPANAWCGMLRRWIETSLDAQGFLDKSIPSVADGLWSGSFGLCASKYTVAVFRVVGADAPASVVVGELHKLGILQFSKVLISEGPQKWRAYHPNDCPPFDPIIRLGELLGLSIKPRDNP